MRDQDNPSHPVELVSWDDIQPFLEKLNDGPGVVGMKFVLPTEAQWEYACRAGTTTYWHYGDREAALQQYGWFASNAGGKTNSVGQLRPNGFGLYDMHGNVWEWCANWHRADCYEKSPGSNPPGPLSGSNRVYRGGCWSYAAGGARSASRDGGGPSFRSISLGFRLALSPSGE